ncbi:hypothetical protein [Bradyrhizobium valentinum]|uniref:Uncharacterized protein n=1 Tax=Bradyrhizobium valentinum TaxID=1518501 RepID=A0A0R3L5B3_9BRAD|nr:hypothetical protein [Bradyrhizobium valentinum]KRR03113.1 hypothetical protein CP49_03970 [Bradyrhizobium valentinum]KRR14047.1 hypothetical protein CQ10_09555 [Bradyrhizobium valentinum]
MKKPKSIADQFQELKKLRISVGRAEMAAARKDEKIAKRKNDFSRSKKQAPARRALKDLGT